jgi:hypothetical protein
MSVSCVRVSQPNALNKVDRVYCMYIILLPRARMKEKGIMSFGLSLLGIIDLMLASIITWDDPSPPNHECAKEQRDAREPFDRDSLNSH